LGKGLIEPNIKNELDFVYRELIIWYHGTNVVLIYY